MKLILANNQSDKFEEFYKSLAGRSEQPFDYAGYDSLLFIFNSDTSKPITAINLANGKELDNYDGVYINGYLSTYELAAATALCCEVLGVSYINKEMQNPPSLSKLTAYAKLAAAGVRIPKTVAGTANALLRTEQYYTDLFPAVLKRADADRGIDNYKLNSSDEVKETLASHEAKSVWILQEYIPNDGFYLVSFYDGQPSFCIFRALQARPDGNAKKAHMYKPKGGANASLIDLKDVPASILNDCTKAVIAMNRQIASVDCIYDKSRNMTYILEVNYNPQLVTIETFKEVRIKAFLDYLNKEWSK